MKKNNVGDDIITNIVIEKEILICKGRFNKDSIADLKRGFPDEIGILEEVQNIYISDKDLRI